MKRTHFKLAVIICLLLCCLMGCQANPNESIVTSKTVNILNKTVENVGVSENAEIERQRYSKTIEDTFSSIDGSINFAIYSDIEVPTSMPIIQVTPHVVTSNEAERIARILFRDVPIYQYSEELSKTDIEEEILSLRQRLDSDELYDQYSGDEGIVKYVESLYENLISKYEEMYENAPDVVEKKVCDWTFYNRGHFYDQTVTETVATDYESYNKSEYIVGMAEINGNTYKYTVCNRNEDDYRIHSISSYIIEDGYNEVCFERPTEERMNELKNVASDLLANMQIGSWVIDTCEVVEVYSLSGEVGYEVVIVACPVYEDIKVSNQGQLVNLKSDDVYASNYYYERIELRYRGETMTFFEYQSPLEVVEVIDANVTIIDSEEAWESAKNYLKLWEAGSTLGVAKVDVEIFDVEVGLTRTRIKNNEEDFYLVPSYTFFGTITGTGFGNADGGVEKQVVAVINAVDGSIINTQLGY